MASVPEVPNARSELREYSTDNAWERRVRDAKRWHLLLEENADTVDLSVGDRIYGQFTPQEFTYDLGASVSDAGGYSREHPLVQWVGGAVETISFQARLFSEHKDDQTATNKFETLKNLKRSLPPNNRPPITRFFWGNAIPGGVQCFVQSLGGVKFDEIRPDGSIRGVSLSITLKRFTPFRVVRVVSSPVEQTPTHTVKDGQTYEMIAQLKWGDPLLGVVLRRMNPRFPMEQWAPKGIADLSSGEIIKIFEKREVTKSRIKPTSHIFDGDDPVSVENRRYFFSNRGRKIAIMPKR